MRLLGLLVDGPSYKTAATELGVSSNTICVHIKNGYSKLQVHPNPEAASKAAQSDELIFRLRVPGRRAPPITQAFRPARPRERLPFAMQAGGFSAVGTFLPERVA